MIPPDFQNFYYWTLEDSETVMKVFINVGKAFNKKELKIEFNEEENSFCLHFLTYIPIIEGELYGKVTKYEIIPDDEKFIIAFYKDESEMREWPLLIRGVRKSTNKIDPHSAYDLLDYITMDLPNRKQLFPEITDFKALLKYSVDSGYLPAVLNGVRALSDDPTQQDEVLGLLIIAADMYQSPEAILKIGVLYYESKETREQSVYYLTKAFELGYGFAALYLGMIYSPLSDIEYEKKDAKQALKYFESISHPIAFHEAAKLYMAGVGTEQDIEKAKSYQKEAEKLEPQISPLDDSLIHYNEQQEKLANEEASKSFISTALSAGATILGAGALFYAAYKFIQKK